MTQTRSIKNPCRTFFLAKLLKDNSLIFLEVANLVGRVWEIMNEDNISQSCLKINHFPSLNPF